MQSRLISLIEALANVMIGYASAVAAQIFVFPMFGIDVSLVDNLSLALVFTGISLIRSYALRRTFERWHRRQRVLRVD